MPASAAEIRRGASRAEVPERDMDHREVGPSVVPTDGHSLMAVAESGQRLLPIHAPYTLLHIAPGLFQIYLPYGN